LDKEDVISENLIFFFQNLRDIVIIFSENQLFKTKTNISHGSPFRFDVTRSIMVRCSLLTITYYMFLSRNT